MLSPANSSRRSNPTLGGGRLLFARSLETLDKLAGEALAEYRACRTKTLDPDKL